jgi:hypothetical protein
VPIPHQRHFIVGKEMVDIDRPGLVGVFSDPPYKRERSARRRDDEFLPRRETETRFHSDLSKSVEAPFVDGGWSPIFIGRTQMDASACGLPHKPDSVTFRIAPTDVGYKCHGLNAWRTSCLIAGFKP